MHMGIAGKTIPLKEPRLIIVFKRHSFERYRFDLMELLLFHSVFQLRFVSFFFISSFFFFLFFFLSTCFTANWEKQNQNIYSIFIYLYYNIFYAIDFEYIQLSLMKFYSN